MQLFQLQGIPHFILYFTLKVKAYGELYLGLNRNEKKACKDRLGRAQTGKDVQQIRVVKDRH